MYTFKNKLLACYLMIFTCSVFSAEASKDPKVKLEQASEKMVNYIATHKVDMLNDVTLSKSLVRSELLPLVDQRGLGRRVLSNRVWNTISELERSEFIELFINLIIDTYASSLTKYNGQQFIFEDTHFNQNGKTALVKSAMLVESELSIKIYYTLKKDENQNWRVVDVTIEGVSMVQSYRSQFAPIIKKNGFPFLLERLKQKQFKLK